MKENAFKDIERTMQTVTDYIADTMKAETIALCTNVTSAIEDAFRHRANIIDKLLNSDEAWNIRQMSYGDKFNLLSEKRRELYTIERFYWKAAGIVHEIEKQIQPK